MCDAVHAAARQQGMGDEFEQELGHAWDGYISTVQRQGRGRPPAQPLDPAQAKSQPGCLLWGLVQHETRLWDMAQVGMGTSSTIASHCQHSL